MQRSRPGQQRLEESHRRYLKLKSVLYDRVTGLPAFPVLIDELRSWLDDRGSIGVLHLEVENLAVVESLYGWQVLDRILARIAAELRGSVGQGVPERSRIALNGIAGERFALFVPQRENGAEITAADLAESCETLGARLERTFCSDEFAGLNPPLDLRIGHALLTLDPFYRFERRVYAALDQARSHVRRREEKRRRGFEEDLRRIIKGTALRTLFQPVVDLRSREVLGYEALSRGPENSPLEMPRAMFAVSDRLGVAADLDHACREAALDAWTAAPGTGKKVFVNGLATSFRGAADDPTQWPRRLQRLAGVPRDVVLEFSERDADGDAKEFVATLKRLKASGFGVALDDMGTGFASQAILEELRPDYLKLDVSLVRKINQNLIKQELLSSLVRIAKRMGASVIAEGVETEEEARALAEAGAQYGQGYLFAHPMARIEETGDRAP